MSIQVKMPSLGESVIEGTITKWLVREGDTIAREQPLIAVATDKADTEVPSPETGRVLKLLVAEGDTIKVGAPLCEIEVGAGASEATPSSKTSPVPATNKVSPARPEGPVTVASAESIPSLVSDTANGRGLSSPVVRKLALEHGVDLEGVSGSGNRGRVTRDDVLRAAGSGEAPQPSPKQPTLPQGSANELTSLLNGGVKFPVPNAGYGSYKVPAYRPNAGDQVIPYSRRRRLTADHMTYSKLTAPHVVTVAEVDLYRTVRLREANKDRYKKEGVPLTLLTFVCAATVRALREFPGINARVLDDSYVVLKNINLGVAVDAPDGLIVPNIKRADELSVRGLAKAVDDVAQRARANKITADDLAGCSFSVTNPGIKGNLFGGAIIAQPNAAILRMGEVQKRAVVVEVDGQDTIAIHPVMYLALSYDHRIIDGVLGNAFLYRVTELLEKGDFEI